MNLGIQGRTALITGASRGIGAATAAAIAAEGARVVAVARSQYDLDQLAESLNGANHIFIQLDLTTTSAISILKSRLDEFNIQPDIVVNNLGGTLEITDPFCSGDDFLKVMSINLGVAIEINNMLIPNMKKNKWGRICHISSISALENQGPPSYSAAKAATNAYVRGISRSLASDNVIVTSLMPGAIHTDGGYWDHVAKTNPSHLEKYLDERMAARRLGRVEEVSNVITFLVSEHSSFMVGSAILVDGGQGRVFQNYE